MNGFILAHIPEILLFITILYTFLTISSIKKYMREHKTIKELVNRCIECMATVINPVVLDNNYAEGGLRQVSKILAGFQNVSNFPLEYTCTEVCFSVNGEKIQTMILRRMSIQNPKCYDDIKIYYDPYNPEQAFAKDMKGILLHNPLRDCIIYGIVAVVCALTFIFISI
ncbi:MAG: hypothetical protein NC177_09005 [Ruminococcus flavefaciens]|nr:hypothetical protein [Ruminococcus flavefaciens]